MATYSRSRDWVYKSLFDGEEGILVPLIAAEADLSTVLVLNSVAAFIWEQLERPCSAQELEGKVSGSFEFEGEREAGSVSRELAGYLGELVRLGAVVRAA